MSTVSSSPASASTARLRRRAAPAGRLCQRRLPDGGVGFVPDDEGRRGGVTVRHLAALGRRRIAHVTGPRSFAAVALRERGGARCSPSAASDYPGEALAGDQSEGFGYAAGQRQRRRRRPAGCGFLPATTRSRAA